MAGESSDHPDIGTRYASGRLGMAGAHAPEVSFPASILA